MFPQLKRLGRKAIFGDFQNVMLKTHESNEPNKENQSQVDKKVSFIEPIKKPNINLITVKS